MMKNGSEKNCKTIYDTDDTILSPVLVGVFAVDINRLLPIEVMPGLYTVLGIKKAVEFNLETLLGKLPELLYNYVLLQLKSDIAVEVPIKRGRFNGTLILRYIKVNMLEICALAADGFVSLRYDDKTMRVANKCVWTDDLYRLLLDDSRIIILDYNCENDVLRVTYNGKNEQRSMLHHDYVRTAKLGKKSMSEAIAGVLRTMTTAETRVFDVHESTQELGYRWYSCKCKSLADATGKVYRIIGMLTDITETKLDQMRMSSLIGTDVLTGVPNRSILEQYFDSYFKKPDSERGGALFFIDFDKFKFINDNYGHLAGDELLRKSAKVISSVLRPRDIFCRYGGDEFVIFIDGMTDRKISEEKAKQIIDAVSTVQIGENIRIHCSIGYTSIIASDSDIVTVIKRADSALLQAKKVGVGTHAYHDADKIGNITIARSLKGKTQVITEQADMSDVEFFVDMFDIMFSTEHLFANMDMILEYVGKRYKASRVYIFESGSAPDTVSNTHEWCNADVESVKDSLQNVTLSYGGKSYWDLFNDDGILFCDNVDEMNPEVRNLFESQQIKSTLQYVIKRNGKPIGMVGYDDCSHNSIWTKDQINSLVFLAKLTAVFLTNDLLSSAKNK